MKVIFFSAKSAIHPIFSFNLDFKDDLAWLLIVPFVTTGSLLLVLHGWTQLNPDLLPTVMTKIKR